MKDIKNYEGLYAITSCGKVYSHKRKKFLKPQVNKSGYLKINLCKNGKIKSFLVHRLVAEVYIDNPNNFDTVDHINGDKSNNSINNLQWMSQADNVRKACNKKVICIETERIFDSTRAVERELGLDQSSVSKCCREKRKTTGSYHFKFYEEGDIK